MSKARVVRAWRAVATEAWHAAGRAGRECPRAMINRAYYALFSEAHAMLLNEGVQPRRLLGTWPHEALPLLVRAHLTRRLGRPRAEQWRRTLATARKLRELADYSPLLSVDARSAMSLLRDARHLVGVSA